jgi:DNA excision repair protein ERCC-2
LRPEEFFKRAGLKPRPQQLEVSEELARMLDSGSVGLEAPPGFGKTIATLIALMAREEFPVTWKVRTYRLARHIADQCSLLDLRYFIMAGRERTCPLKDEYGSNLHVYCKNLKFKCPYFRDISSVNVDLGKAFSYEDLPKNACSYYLQQLVRAKVYIAPYYIGLRIPGLEVYDEAHNLVLEIGSIPVTKVKEALSELGLDPSRDYIDAISELEVKLTEKLERGEKPLVAGKVLSALRNATILWREQHSIHMLKLRKPLFKSIFISATLSPLEKIFKVPIIRIPPVKRKALLVNWVTTRFAEWDVRMAEEINDVIFLLRKYFRRIAIFGTERVLSMLKYNYFEDEVENKDDWDVAAFLSRGRRSEGVNLRADCVVLAGAFFLPPDLKLEKVGVTRHDVATIVAIQNIGRVVRTPSDMPLIILADERFRELKDLANYLDIEEVNDLKSLDALLRRYHAR